MKTKKQNKGKIISIILALILIFIIWVTWTNMNITTSHVTIENKKIPAEFSGFKIAQVSDLHNHQWGEKLIKKLKMEKPDIIAITGDLVDSSHTDVDIAMEFIKQARDIAPVYYVTGNHEAWIEDYKVLEEKLIKAKVNMMDDECTFIKIGDSQIQILGVQDPEFVEKEDEYNIQSINVRIKLDEQIKKDYFNIVLSHRPELFEQYVIAKADLVLSGHAHGGQIRFPFIGGLVAPNQGLFPKYTSGLYTEESTTMVVSRGLGNSIIPIRINNTPELVIIILKTR